MKPYRYVCPHCGHIVSRTAGNNGDTVFLYDFTAVLDLSDVKGKLSPFFTAEELTELCKEWNDGKWHQIQLKAEDVLSICKKRRSITSRIPNIGDFQNFLFPIIKDSVAETENLSDNEKEELQKYRNENNSDITAVSLNPTEQDMIKDIRKKGIREKAGSVFKEFFAIDENTEKLSEYDSVIKNISDKFYKSNTRGGNTYLEEKPIVLSLCCNPNQNGTVIDWKKPNRDGSITESGRSESGKPIIAVCGFGNCFIKGTSPTPIPKEAWVYPQKIIGFIGTRASGKTCLLTAVSNNYGKSVQNNHIAGAIQLGNLYRNFSNNIAPDKTKAESEFDDRTYLVNASVLVNATILTFADVSGEAFDFENGKFYQEKAGSILQYCTCYVICIDPQNRIYTDDHSANTNATLHQFMDVFAGNQCVPVVFAVTKADELLDKTKWDTDGYGKTLSEKAYYAQCKDYIKNTYKKIYEGQEKRIYMAGIVCSAYGKKPKPPMEIRKQLSDILPLNDPAEKLYLQSEGRYYIANAKVNAEDRPVIKGEDDAFPILLSIDKGSEKPIFFFDPTEEVKATLENPQYYTLQDVIFIKDEKKNSENQSGTLFIDTTPNEQPNPQWIEEFRSLLEGICGVRQISYHYENQNSEKERTYYCNAPETWEYGVAHTVEEARCICSLFWNYTDKDKETAESVLLSLKETFKKEWSLFWGQMTSKNKDEKTK